MNNYDEFPDVPPYMLDGVEDTDSSVTPDPDIEEVIEELHKDDDIEEDEEDVIDEDEEELEDDDEDEEEDPSDED